MFQATAAVTKISVSTPMLATCWLVNTSGKPQAASRTTASPAYRSAGPPGRLVPGPLTRVAPRPALSSLGPRLLAAEQAPRPEREHHHERRVEHRHRPGR